MIQLNINYDPSYPPDYPEYPDDPIFSAPEPRFPLRGNSVRVLGVSFTHRRVNTPGPDPYSGDRWVAQVGSPRSRLGSLNFTIEFIVGFGAELEWVKYEDDPRILALRHGFKELFTCHRYYVKDAPWVLRKLWDFLDYRLYWEQCHEPAEDDYPGY